MKTLKGWLTGGALLVVLALGSTVAKAGDGVIFGATDDSRCNVNSGVIFGDSGVIFGGVIFGGVIFGSADDTGACTDSDMANSGLLISD